MPDLQHWSGILALVLGIIALVLPLVFLKQKSLPFRAALGVALGALTIGVVPALGDGKISPYLVAVAIAALCFLILADSTSGDDSSF